jgi:hypothetical protein
LVVWFGVATPRLRLDHDRLFDAFKVAHGHIGVRVFELEVLRAIDRQLLAVIIGRGLPSTAISL